MPTSGFGTRSVDVLLRRIAPLLATVPLAISTIGLVAWITGMLRLASVRTEYIPMAPSTAIALLLLSGGVMACSPRAPRRTVRLSAPLP